MFGLYGRKGVIQPGADADIVVYDPNGHTSIGIGEGRKHHMNMDHSAWEGFEIDGHVDVTISRGACSWPTAPTAAPRDTAGS